jgi:hypothetical protein
VCRDFATEECKQANQLSELKKLKAPAGADNILSLTLSVQGADVESDEIKHAQVSAALSVLKAQGIVEDGVMGVERGSANDHLHMQIMLHGRFLRSSRKRKHDGDTTHQSVLKTFFNDQNCFNRSWYCFVRVHETSAEVSWESMAGCGSGYASLMPTYAFLVCIQFILQPSQKFVATYAVPHACVHSCIWCSGVHAVYVMLHEVARPSTMAGSSIMHVVHGTYL